MIFGTTIFSTIQTEYCDHEVYYSVMHFTISGIAGISTPVYTPLLHSMCVFTLSWFSAEMFFNRKVGATRSTVLTIF
jgi:hypothetical protein